MSGAGPVRSLGSAEVDEATGRCDFRRLMTLPPLILASASPRRAELLSQLGFQFQVIPSAVSEAVHEPLTPGELAQLNAYRKARLVAKHHPDKLVLGADTLVSLGPRVFGKPGSLTEASEMLLQLAGTRHYVITGVCLIHLRVHRQCIFAATTAVTFRRLNPEQVQDYLSHSNPLDKAGGYAIQEEGDRLVERIEGSFSNVVGLPVERLEVELRKFASVGGPV